MFIGGVHEAEPAFQALLGASVEVPLVVTLPVQASARVSGWVDLAPLAARHGVPVERTDDVNAEATVDLIRHARPDLVVVAGWSRLLRRELLAVPPRGCVGFHASLLPRHRGRAPVNWAIAMGERVTGNTMLMLVPEADRGDIVDQREVPIGPDDTCADVYARVGAAGAAMLGAHLRALLAGRAPRRPQQDSLADLLPKRTPDMGITVWDRPARAVHDWIRALTLPYPGAYSLLRGRPLMLWRSALPRGGPEGPSGRILAWDDDGMRVAAADGSVLVTSVSDAGDPPEAAAAWCRRNGLRPGTDFDPVDAESARCALGPLAAPAAAPR